MKETSNLTCNTGLVLKSGMMAQNILEIIIKDSNKAKALSYGKTLLNLQAIGTKIKSTAKVNTFGMTGGPMKGIG